MSVADITIEEDLFEDLDSSCDGEGESACVGEDGGSPDGRGQTKRGNGEVVDDDDGKDDAAEKGEEGDWNNVDGEDRIECTSVSANSQFGELSEYGERTEVGAGSEWGGGSEYGWGTMSCCGGDEEGDDADSSGVCKYECGRGYSSGGSEVGRGYIDCEGNVNTDEARDGQRGGDNEADASLLNLEASLHLEDHREGIRPDIDATCLSSSKHCEDTTKANNENQDFILSFPSPEKRAEIRHLSTSGLNNEDEDEDDIEDDDDDEAELPFPTFEEREMIRMGNKSWAPRAGASDECKATGGIDANDGSFRTWTCEGFHDSLRMEALDQQQPPTRNNRSRRGGGARGGGGRGRGGGEQANWVEKMFLRKRQNREAAAALSTSQ